MGARAELLREQPFDDALRRAMMSFEQVARSFGDRRLSAFVPCSLCATLALQRDQLESGQNCSDRLLRLAQPQKRGS